MAASLMETTSLVSNDRLSPVSPNCGSKMTADCLDVITPQSSLLERKDHAGGKEGVAKGAPNVDIQAAHGYSWTTSRFGLKNSPMDLYKLLPGGTTSSRTDAPGGRKLEQEYLVLDGAPHC